MTLQGQRDEKKDITVTAARVELDGQLAVLCEQHKREIVEVRKEMKETLAANDLKAKKELEHARADSEKKIARIEADRER